MKVALKEKTKEPGIPICELLPGKLAKIISFPADKHKVGKIVMVPSCDHSYLCLIEVPSGWVDFKRCFNSQVKDKENYRAEYLKVGDILEIVE